MLARYDELSMKLAEPMEDDEMTALLAEIEETQNEIDAGDLWNLDMRKDRAMESLRCPPPDAADPPARPATPLQSDHLTNLEGRT